MIQIFSPSRRRAKLVTSHKAIDNVVYVVHEEEAQDYLQEGLQIKICPNEIKGNIARIRNWILDNSGDRVVMVDDDIKKMVFVEGRNRKKLSPIQAFEFIEKGFELADEMNVRLWGVNLNTDVGCYRTYQPFSLSSVVLGPFCCFLKMDLRYDERLSLKEDYDLAIQVLNKYRKILRFNYAHYVCAHQNMKGGCSIYRTRSRELAQFELIQKKWGKKIIKMDKQKESTKIQDINPIVKAPIRGV